MLLPTRRPRLISLGILHTIFFHRTFPAVRPIDRDLLDISLPAVDDVDLETLIDQRATTLVRQLDDLAQQPQGGSGRGQLAVQFFEKRRKKTYFFGKADEEVCWEQWTLDVTLAKPRTESGMLKCTPTSLTMALTLLKTLKRYGVLWRRVYRKLP